MKEKRSLTEDTSAGDEGNIERKGASPRPLPSRKSLCLGVEETRTCIGNNHVRSSYKSGM